jgi:diguanylate cyclase (GGDEF)-like protein
VFRDLAIWMLSLGLIIGLAFPFFVIVLGVPRETALTPAFFAACLAAGAIAGAFNFGLARWIVGGRLRGLARSMSRVEERLEALPSARSASDCLSGDCLIPVDSEDEIGEAARAFNSLVEALSVATQTQLAARSFAEMLASDLAIEGLARNALTQLLEHTGASAGAIAYERDGELLIAAAQGIHDPAAVLSSEHVRKALLEGATYLTEVPPDVQVDAVLVAFRPREMAVLPVRHKGVPLGALVLATGATFDDAHRARLELSLHGLGLALNNALAHERMQTLAAIDPLTGAYNRRFGLQRLREEFGRAVRAGTPLGLLMLDIDHFKAVNDTYSHLVGDRVLRSMSGVIRAALREGDILLRYGGEEFLAVLPAASSDDLPKLAERIRRMAAAAEVKEGDIPVRVTVSVGGAAYPNQAVEHEEALIQLADKALYRAKELGRDRVEIAR